MFSILEAIFFGVPIIALPIFLDQPENAARISKMGYGLMLSNKDVVTSSEIEEKINEVLINPT